MTKDNKINVFVGCLGFAGTILGAVIGNMYGTEKQNEYIQSQVANVTGDDNTVTINSVDDLVKDYNKLLEENETLKDQNKDYFEDNKEAKSTIESLEKQLGDTPAIRLKDLGLCIDGEDKNINRNNSYAIINGLNYYSEDFLHSLLSDTKEITIKDDTMFLGEVIADRDTLFSKRIIDSYSYNVKDNITDSYGNVHSK